MSEGKQVRKSRSPHAVCGFLLLDAGRDWEESLDSSRINPSELTKRIARSIEALNQGNLDPLLQGYAEDVVVLTPIFRLGEAVGEAEIRGKDAVRDYLLNYRALYQSFTLTSAFPNERGFVAVIKTALCNSITMSVELNDQGLGQRLLMFHT